MLEAEKTLELFFQNFQAFAKCAGLQNMITYAEHGHFNMSAPLHRKTMG